ncbi:MAG: NUDIX domain-containing protein [Candidatus Pacebacteria bacterium]|nr:NUDIX domain-containing protein [Candidatus Paceibacterota bacterium]
MSNKYEGQIEVVGSPIIVNRRGEILLIKSYKWGDKYLIPGGHAEVGEMIFETAKREGEEETGLKLEPQFCVNIGELIYDPDFYRKAHLVYFHIVCNALTDDIRLDEKELKEFIWIEPKKALDLALTKGVKKSLENYINGIRIDINSFVND